MARMKLILTQEVDGLGAPGDVVDVAAGYGRNYLLPRGFGITWTRGGDAPLLSFVTVGIIWANHHNLFRLVGRAWRDWRGLAALFGRLS